MLQLNTTTEKVLQLKKLLQLNTTTEKVLQLKKLLQLNITQKNVATEYYNWEEHSKLIDFFFFQYSSRVIR